MAVALISGSPAAAFSAYEADKILTVDVDLGSGTGLKFVACLFASVTGDTAASRSVVAATLNGGGMTIGSVNTNQNNRAYQLLYAETTLTGVQTISVEATTDNGNFLLNAAAWDGITSGAISGIVPAHADNSSPSWTVTSETGHEVVVLLIEPEFNSTLTPGTGTSVLSGYPIDTSSRHHYGLREDGASSVTIGGTYPGTRGWMGVAFSLEPGSGGTDPTLSDPVFTATGSTTGTAEVDTDVAAGTLYCVITTSATTPSDAQIMDGEDHTGAAAAWDGSDATPTVGTNTFSPTGLSPSTTYYAHFHHDTGAGDTISSAGDTTAAPADPPVITVQPVADTVKAGQTAEFTITATGSGTVTYQWQEDSGAGWGNISNGGAYSGATSDTLSIVTTRAMDANEYRCNVSDDDAGPVTSSEVLLTVQQCVLALSGVGYEFLNGNSAATAAVVASTTLNVAAYPASEWPPASAIATASGATDADGNLADLGDDGLTFGTTYRLVARNPSNGETWAWTMTAS
jgi:hypothetical protein